MYLYLKSVSEDDTLHRFTKPDDNLFGHPELLSCCSALAHTWCLIGWHLVHHLWLLSASVSLCT